MFGLDLLSAVVRVSADSSAFDQQIAGLSSRVDALGSRMGRAFGPCTASLAALGTTAKATTAALGATAVATRLFGKAALYTGGTALGVSLIGVGLLGKALTATAAPLATTTRGVLALGAAAAKASAGPLRALGTSFVNIAAMARTPLATIRAMSEGIARLSLSAGLIASFAGGRLRSALASAPGRLGRGLVGGMEAVGGAAGNIFGGIAQRMGDAFSGKSFAEAIGVVARGIGNALSGIVSTIGGLGKRIASFVQDAVGSLAGLGKAAAGLASGALSLLGGAAGALGNVFAGLGAAVMGLASAVGGILAGAFEALKAVVSGLIGVVHGLLESLRSVAAAIDQALVTGLKLAAGAALGVTAALAGTIKVGGDYEATLVGLKRVTGMTADETARLGANLQAIARNNPGASLGQVYKIASFAGRLGVGGDTSDGKIKAITNLTASLSKLQLVLEDFDVESAATQMLRVLKTFHQGEGASQNFAAALVAIDNASTATGQELLNMVQRLSGVGSTLGATIPQMLALAAAMRDSGADVEASTTAVSRLMMEMAQDSAKFAGAVGLDVKELAATIRTDPVKAVEMWLKALRGLDKTASLKVLESLGMEGRRTGQILLQVGRNIDSVGRFTKTANGEWTSMAALEKAVADASQQAWEQVKLLGNRLLLIGTEVGHAVLPAFKALVGVVNYFADRTLSAIQAMGPAMKRWGEQVADAIGLAKTAIDEWPAWLTVFQLKTKEAFNNLIAIVSRLRTPLVDTFRDIFAAITQLTANAFGRLAHLAGNAGREISLALREGIAGSLLSKLENPLLKALMPETMRAGLMTAAGVIAPSEEERKRKKRGLAAVLDMEGAPGLMDGVRAPRNHFKGVLDNLPPGLEAKDQGLLAAAWEKILGRKAAMEAASPDMLAMVMGGAAGAGAARLGLAGAIGGAGLANLLAGARFPHRRKGTRHGLVTDADLDGPRAFGGGPGLAGAIGGAMAAALPVAARRAAADAAAKAAQDRNQKIAAGADAGRFAVGGIAAAAAAAVKKMQGGGERAREDHADAKLVAGRRFRGGRVPIPQAPAAGRITEGTGTFHSIEEFAAMMMRPGAKEEDKTAEAVDAATKAVGESDSVGLRGQLAATTKAVAALAQNGVPIRFANA